MHNRWMEMLNHPQEQALGATQPSLLRLRLTHLQGAPPLRVGSRVKNKQEVGGRCLPLQADCEPMVRATSHFDIFLCFLRCLTFVFLSASHSKETFIVCPGHQYRKFNAHQSNGANWDCCSTVHGPVVSIVRAWDRKPTPPCSHQVCAARFISPLGVLIPPVS